MPLIRIAGIVELDEETSHAEFVEAWLAWLDEHGWEFEGETSLAGEEEEDE